VCPIICLWSRISFFRDGSAPALLNRARLSVQRSAFAVQSSAEREMCRRVGDGAYRRASIVLVLVFPFSVQRSPFRVQRKGRRVSLGRNVLACRRWIASAFSNRARRRLLTPTSRTTTTTRTIPQSQPAFGRQRSTVKIDNENEHEHDNDWGGDAS
jgi:hypothetical protein